MGFEVNHKKLGGRKKDKANDTTEIVDAIFEAEKNRDLKKLEKKYRPIFYKNYVFILNLLAKLLHGKPIESVKTDPNTAVGRLKILKAKYEKIVRKTDWIEFGEEDPKLCFWAEPRIVYYMALLRGDGSASPDKAPIKFKVEDTII